MARKGYPSEFTAHLRTKLNDVKDAADAAASIYAGQIIKGEESLADVSDATAALMTAQDALAKTHTAAKSGIFTDIKRLGIPTK